MNIQIIAVGSELLTPYYQDSDSLYLTRGLNDLGLSVRTKIVIGDELESLAAAVRRSRDEADLILITGGLGPTGDDRTREAVSFVFGRPLVLQEDIVASIEERFRRRGRTMPPVNRKQAEILEGAEVLANPAGTAPGQWLDAGGKTVILLPGPPHELRAICESQVWPRLRSRQRAFLSRRVLKTAGLTESEIESLIDGMYPREQALDLTVLASPGQIELHVAAASDVSAADADQRSGALAAKLRERLGRAVFSENGADLETVVGRSLARKKKTIAVAESCSGGLLCRRLTGVPGSSAYFLEGFVTYSNAAKTARLNVPAETIETNGAVSAETAAAMADGVRKAAGADYGLAVTGIAGPSGGSEEKPVGLVFCAVSDGRRARVERSVFLGDRVRVQQQAAQKTLDFFRRLLEEDPEP
ncbi:MAG: competence/damage-inducible protein A [Candidatus Aminicenantes bacterium]|nr:competence/damage-inducible protein A [Candidatus Aminicenantes bacterium]